MSLKEIPAKVRIQSNRRRAKARLHYPVDLLMFFVLSTVDFRPEALGHISSNCREHI